MGDTGVSDQMFQGSHHALVIGISKYQHGKTLKEGEDVVLAPNEFPNLTAAAKDAGDFAEFLRSNGCIPYNVIPLINEQATRRAILNAFKDLRIACAQSPDTLVILYFSGHGWLDPEGLSYLVPHEAERDDLVGTALANEEISRLVAGLNTDRLVMFMDACHSGGIAAKGTKGAAEGFATPVLGEGRGRFVIASCRPEQNSLEVDGNGIFTRNLLLLLRGETNDIPDEEITPFGLFEPLKKRVVAAAKAMKIPAEQEPVAPLIENASSLVIAINKKKRSARLLTESQDKERKTKFLGLLSVQLVKQNSQQGRVIKGFLASYVDNLPVPPSHDELCKLFEAHLVYWMEGDEPGLIHICQDLFREYEFIRESMKAARQAAPVEAPKPVDAFENAAPQPERAAAAGPVPSAPQAPTARKTEVRQLSPEDVISILEPFDPVIEYFSDSRVLKRIMGRAISTGDFIRAVSTIPQRTGEEEHEALLDEVVKRFRERWNRAPVVEPRSIADVRIDKK